jgi:hypothetical protein
VLSVPVVTLIVIVPATFSICCAAVKGTSVAVATKAFVGSTVTLTVPMQPLHISLHKKVYGEPVIDKAGKVV